MFDRELEEWERGVPAKVNVMSFLRGDGWKPEFIDEGEINECYGYVYLIYNRVTGMKYVGKHKIGARESYMSYLGSGRVLKEESGVTGRESLSKFIIRLCDDEVYMTVMENICISLVFKRGDFLNMLSGYASLFSGGDVGMGSPISFLRDLCWNCWADDRGELFRRLQFVDFKRNSRTGKTVRDGDGRAIVDRYVDRSTGEFYSGSLVSGYWRSNLCYNCYCKRRVRVKFDWLNRNSDYYPPLSDYAVRDFLVCRLMVNYLRGGFSRVIERNSVVNVLDSELFHESCVELYAFLMGLFEVSTIKSKWIERDIVLSDGRVIKSGYRRMYLDYDWESFLNGSYEL